MSWGVLRRNSEAPLTTDADRSSFFVALVVVDVLAGLADSISGPYVVLFLVNQAGLGPLALSAILTARALCGIAFATTFGAWVDRKTSVAPLLLALAGSAVGYALLGFTTDFAVLLVIASVPIAIGAAAFSQSIVLVKRNFDRSSPHTANRAIGVMRASWSLAWAIGPAVGALIVGSAGFRAAFFTSAASAVIALAILALVRSRPAPPSATHDKRQTSVNGGTTIALAFAALALFHTAMFLGSIPLPIVLITSLGGAESDVGIAMSLCAALEIIVMGVLIWRPLKRGVRAAIVAGFAAFVAYLSCWRSRVRLARSSGRRFSARSGSLSSAISGSGSCSRSCRIAPAPRRRCFRTPDRWVRCLPRSASAAWRKRLATRRSSSFARLSAPRVSF